jgi:hypothetical protein
MGGGEALQGCDCYRQGSASNIIDDAHRHRLTLRVRNMMADPDELRKPEIVQRAWAAA